jgi:hypothetical protein
VEKDQVTIALRASGLDRPVGTPILFVTYAQTGAVHELQIFREVNARLVRVETFQEPYGPLSSFAADVWATTMGDCLYGWIVQKVGVQGVLETLP